MTRDAILPDLSRSSAWSGRRPQRLIGVARGCKVRVGGSGPESSFYVYVCRTSVCIRRRSRSSRRRGGGSGFPGKPTDRAHRPSAWIRRSRPVRGGRSRLHCIRERRVTQPGNLETPLCSSLAQGPAGAQRGEWIRCPAAETTRPGSVQDSGAALECSDGRRLRRMDSQIHPLPRRPTSR